MAMPSCSTDPAPQEFQKEETEVLEKVDDAKEIKKGLSDVDDSVFYVLNAQAVLLKLARLYGMGSTRLSGGSVTGIPSIVFLCLCGLFPSRTSALVSVGLTLVAYGECLPRDVDNSGMWEFFGLMMLFWGLLPGVWPKESNSLDDLVAPAVRKGFVIMYFWAAFAKWNYDWFDHQTSCTTTFTIATLDRVSWLHGLYEEPWGWWLLTLLKIVPAVMALWECLVPALFAVPKFRLAGVYVLFGLHLVLSPLAWDYTPPMAWQLFFWAPRAHRNALKFMTVGPLGRACTVVTVAIFAADFLKGPRESMISTSECAFWTWYGLFCFGVIRGVLATEKGSNELVSASLAFPAKISWWRTVPMYIVLAGLTLNGAAPYLGMKTLSTWSMFSNLRVENGSTNHFLVPASAQIFEDLSDVVHVDATDFSILKSFHQTTFGDVGSSKPAQAFTHRYGLDSHLTVNMALAQRLGSNSTGGRAGSEKFKVNFVIPRTILKQLVSLDGLAKNSNATFFIDSLYKGHTARFEVQDGTVVRDDAQLLNVPPFWKRKLLWSRSYKPGLEGRCSL